MPRRARRTFTPQFKAEVVLALLTGQQSAAELCRTHQLSPTLLSLWKETYLDRLPVVFQADEQRSPNWRGSPSWSNSLAARPWSWRS